MYPEARGSSLPGPYDVAVGSEIQDTSLTDELSSYYQSERGKTATSSHGLRDCEEIFRLKCSAVARSPLANKGLIDRFGTEAPSGEKELGFQNVRNHVIA